MFYCEFELNGVTYIIMFAACTKFEDIETMHQMFDSMSILSVNSRNAVSIVIFRMETIRR